MKMSEEMPMKLTKEQKRKANQMKSKEKYEEKKQEKKWAENLISVKKDKGDALRSFDERAKAHQIMKNLLKKQARNWNHDTSDL